MTADHGSAGDHPQPPPLGGFLDPTQMARTVNEAKLSTLGMLVAGIAHELNTPLGALHSNHDVLKRALSKLQAILADEVVDPHELDEVRRVVRAVDGVLRVNDLAVERMVSLVASLRDFGRVDRAERDRIDVRATLDGTLAILAHELGDRITVVRDYGDVPEVECFPQQLNQLFMNLLLNAIQAIPAEGTIRISTGSSPTGVQVRIEDDGVGIPDELRARIFEPGFSTKGPRIGMGLGLLIVRQIVDLHGGTIQVQSCPGKGTSFTVELPLTLPIPAKLHSARPLV